MLLLFFIKKTLGTVYESELPHQPKYIIVASRQRSSSSTLSSMIGSHPCVLSGNEMFTDKPGQDKIGVHSMVNMSHTEISDNPERFLLEAHEKACQGLPSMCNGKCTISIKLFDIHGVNKVEKLVNNKDFFFVVLEREVRGEFCSHMKAKTLNDWGTTPAAHKSVEFNCPETEIAFIEKHNYWFHLVRSSLTNASRFFMDIPFSVVASCELRNLVNSIYGATGLPILGKMDLNTQMRALFDSC